MSEGTSQSQSRGPAPHGPGPLTGPALTAAGSRTTTVVAMALTWAALDSPLNHGQLPG
jgi:hypothetical protein